MSQSQDIRTIRYRFKFAENNEQIFTIRLDGQTLALLDKPQRSYPEWTKLKYQKCVNCPLSEAQHEYCPIAQKLVGTADFFCKPLPFKEVDLSVETPERTFSKRTDLKSAAVSLIGIYMATSGCPIMDPLRPMVRHHLPLATTPETTYRHLSNYLIAQYLLARQSKSPDWALKDLGKIYDAIKTVNTYFRERLLKISSEDYALSAILSLDASAYYINLSLIGDTFYTIETLFEEDLPRRNLSYDGIQDENNTGDLTTYKYRFIFQNNYRKEFVYQINAETLKLVRAGKGPAPSWTKLSCHKCPHCPLGEGEQYCPAALSVANVMEFLREALPTENVNVLVESAQRDYSKRTALSDGLSSLIGLAAASSGCPVFAKLKPFIRHHLPFETPPEQIYRSLGMYLLNQKFSEKNKTDPDWDLTRFTEFFGEINSVSSAFCERLKEVPLEEKPLNMVTHLDFFRKYLDFKISDDNIKELQKLFGQSCH
jgi:hypothetical protein